MLFYLLWKRGTCKEPGVPAPSECAGAHAGSGNLALVCTLEAWLGAQAKWEKSHVCCISEKDPKSQKQHYDNNCW